MIFGCFDHIFCIGLRKRLDRREHIRKEFGRAGITRFEWIDAFDKRSSEVRAQYESGKVKSYPPCFRCGMPECNCENKKLIPEQVGNWLSHLAAWQSVDGDHLSLICEDDIKFTDRFDEGVEFVKQSPEVTSGLNSKRLVLVRLGWALSDEHSSNAGFHFSQNLKMSNPCYAINQKMAELLTYSLVGISTTSDVYIHESIGSGVEHFTIHPPVAYELSWSTGELRSDIRPKQVYISELKRLLASLDEDDAAIPEILAFIEDETRRLKLFEVQNNLP